MDNEEGGVTYTAQDIANADKFAEYNLRVRMLSKMYERAPHLLSWIKVSWRPATDDDFYVPESLKNSARVLKVEYTDTFCRMINCQNMKEQDSCVPNELPSWYRVGDDAWDVQCQAACFNTARKVTYDAKGKRAPDVPWVNFHNGECRIVNPSATAMEKTFYRAEEKFELRVNDMPTGFSRIKNPEPHSCGYTYRNNPTYCSYFDMHWTPKTEECSQTGLEYVVDSVLGMALINNIRSVIRSTTNSGKPFDPPTGLPGPPQLNPPEMYTLRGWRKNINTDFRLPELVDPFPTESTSDGEMNTRSKRSASETVSKDSEVFRKSQARRETERRIAAEKFAAVEGDTDDEYEDRDDEHTGRKKRRKRDIVKIIQSVKLNLDEVVQQIITAAYNSIHDPNTLASLGINFVTDTLIYKIRKTALTVAQKMTMYLGQGALRFAGGRLGLRVITGSVRSLGVRVISTFAVRVGAKAVLALAKLLVAAASVVGWILVVGGLIDLALGFWDPFNYKKMLPATWPKDAMNAYELALSLQYGKPDPSYGVDELAVVLLSEEEQWDLQMSSIFDRAAYLNSLVVNSEGSVIDKGQLVDTNSLPSELVERTSNSVAAAQYRFDETSFLADTKRFNYRMKLNAILNAAAVVAFALGTASLFVKFHIFAMILMIVAVICICFSIASAQYDLLLEPYVRAQGDGTVDQDLSAA